MNPLPTEQQPTAVPDTTAYQPPILTRYGSLVGVTQGTDTAGKNSDVGVTDIGNCNTNCYS